jgi:hypothetical protein
MTIPELREVIARINAEQDFDLAWRWAGTGETPTIEIYEEADGHMLTGGTLENIEERLRRDLPAWGLEYPDDINTEAANDA